MTASYPLKLAPVYKETVWGGSRLRTLFPIQSGPANIAESWELSTLENGASRVLNGPFAGKTLSEALGGAALPVLIKLIDAGRPLSIQVHPSDASADSARGERGKSETWLILAAEADSTIVYGLRDSLTAAELRAAAEDGSIERHLNRVPARAGDIFPVEPGTIHAIGAGIVLAEVQQSSDTTFRLYDYGRPGADGRPRPLHLDRACAVADCTGKVHDSAPKHLSAAEREPVFDACGFRSDFRRVNGALTLGAADVYYHLLILEGSGSLRCGGESFSLQKGSSWFLPRGLGECELSGKLEILCTSGKEYQTI